MIDSRAIASSSQSGSQAGSQAVATPGKVQARAVQQDHQGPLDGELLDLYVAILVAVPLACFLKSLWF